MTSLWCYLVHPPVNWGSNGQTLTQNITKHVHISLSLSLCVFFLVKHIEGKNARLWCEVFQVQLGYQQGNHVDCHQGKVDYRSHTHTLKATLEPGTTTSKNQVSKIWTCHTSCVTSNWWHWWTSKTLSIHRKYIDTPDPLQARLLI